LPTQGTAVFTPPESVVRRGGQTVFTILAAISACHLLNDLVQATIPSLYPLFQRIFGLTLGQIGMITFTYQITASLFQPFVGMATDKKPMPYSLALGMTFSLCGLVLMAYARPPMDGCSSPARLSVSAPPSSIPSPRVSPASPPAASMASRSRSFSSAETSAPPSVRCSSCGWCFRPATRTPGSTASCGSP
jgi:hypothetical protein